MLSKSGLFQEANNHDAVLFSLMSVFIVSISVIWIIFLAIPPYLAFFLINVPMMYSYLHKRFPGNEKRKLSLLIIISLIVGFICWNLTMDGENQGSNTYTPGIRDILYTFLGIIFMTSVIIPIFLRKYQYSSLSALFSWIALLAYVTMSSSFSVVSILLFSIFWFLAPYVYIKSFTITASQVIPEWLRYLFDWFLVGIVCYLFFIIGPYAISNI